MVELHGFGEHELLIEDKLLVFRMKTLKAWPGVETPPAFSVVEASGELEPDAKASTHRHVRGGSPRSWARGVLGMAFPAQPAAPDETLTPHRWRSPQAAMKTDTRPWRDCAGGQRSGCYRSTQAPTPILKNRRSPNTRPRSTSSCSTTFATSTRHRRAIAAGFATARAALWRNEATGQNEALARVEDEIRGLLNSGRLRDLRDAQGVRSRAVQAQRVRRRNQQRGATQRRRSRIHPADEARLQGTLSPVAAGLGAAARRT